MIYDFMFFNIVDAACNIGYKNSMMRIVLFLFLISFVLISIAEGSSGSSGNSLKKVLIGVKEELKSGSYLENKFSILKYKNFKDPKGLTSLVNSDFSRNISSNVISKVDSRKRLLYWLNYRNSSLARVDASPQDVYFSDGEKRVAGISPSSFPQRKLSSVESKTDNTSLIPKVFLSYRERDVLLSSVAEGREYEDLSESLNTKFLTILGFHKTLKNNQTADFNLLVNRNQEAELRLKDISLNYNYELPLTNSFKINPFFSVFLPVNINDEENRAGIILSPGVSLNSVFPDVLDFRYSIYYYHHTANNNKRSLLNTVSVNKEIKKVNFECGLAGFVSRANPNSFSQFLTTYYSLLTRHSRVMKISATVQTASFESKKLAYSLGWSYNF